MKQDKRNKLTTKKKLYLLSFVLLANVGLIGGAGYWFSKGSQLHIIDLSQKQIPNVQNVTLLDMMHDGLRAVAYRAIISYNASKEEKDSIQEEVNEFSKNINEYLAVIEKNVTEPETKADIETTKPHLEAYVKDAGELVSVALSGKQVEALKLMPKFQDSFKKLEENLEKLGEKVEHAAQEETKLASSFSEQNEKTSLALMIFGLIVGALSSFWIIKDLTKTLGQIIHELEDESSSINARSTDVNSSSQSLSQATTEQATAIQQTAASVEEITAMVKKTSDNSKRLEKAAQLSHVAATQGQESIEEMLNAMGTISTSNTEIMKQVEESNERITDIVRVISEIGNKTKVINDIVFQTKLLSFNASVEAARAGEHGKGFAVVAEEVGNLAQMSGTAAKEISDMLNASIEKVESIVADTKKKVEVLISDGKEKVEQGSEVAKQCGQSLDEIVKQVSEVNTMINEITTAIQEQNQGIGEISKAVSELDKTTQENAANAEQSYSTANELLTRAETLKNIVHHLESTTLGTVTDKQNVEKSPVKSSKSNVVSLKKKPAEKFKKETSTPVASIKKAVGDDFVPDENDDRFKDI